MSNVAYLNESVDMILGQEFLTWLWYKSECANVFKDKEGNDFSVFMEQRIVVQGGQGEFIETATVSGPMSELREVRLGLTTGKKVTRALIRLEQEPESWQLNLKAEDFCLGSFKTPKIDKADKDDDPEAQFFEKIYLLEKALAFLDLIFKEFLTVRLSSNWKEELKSFKTWLYPEEN